MATLNWELKLADLMSSPAAKAATSVEALKKALEGAAKASDKLDSAMAKTAKMQMNSGGRVHKTIFDQKLGGKTPMPKRIEKATSAASAAWDRLSSRFEAGRSGSAVKQGLGDMLTKLSPRMSAFAGNLMEVAGSASMVLGPIMSLVGGITKFVGAAAGISIAGFVAGTLHIREVQAFRESTLFAFENILKSKTEAQRVFDMASKTSFDIGADFKTSVGGMNTLLAQGFDAKFADQLIRRMADLRTINPAADLERMVKAIGQIKATGRLQGDELMQLVNAGISVEDVYKHIAKAMNVTAKNGKTVNEQVADLQQKAKISSQVAIDAIMASIAEKTGGGAAGDVAAKRAGSTVEGVMMRAMNLKDQLLGAIKIDWSPVTRGVQRFMDALSSPKGVALLDAIGTSITRVLAKLDGVSQSDMESFLDKLGTVIVATADMIEGLVDAAITLGPVFGFLADSLAAVFHVIGEGGSSLDDLFDGIAGAGKAAAMPFLAIGAGLGMLWDAFDALGQVMDVASINAYGDAIRNALAPLERGIDWMAISGQAGLDSVMMDIDAWVPSIFAKGMSLGNAITNGMVSGISAGLSSVVNAVVGVADSAVAAARAKLGIASPSKVFFDMFEQVPAGATGGINKGAPSVAGASRDMGQASIQGSMGALGALAGSRVAQSYASTSNQTSINAPITITDAKDPRSTANEVASQLRTVVASRG